MYLEEANIIVANHIVRVYNKRKTIKSPVKGYTSIENTSENPQIYESGIFFMPFCDVFVAFLWDWVHNITCKKFTCLQR